jgi:hypothetical protein
MARGAIDTVDGPAARQYLRGRQRASLLREIRPAATCPLSSSAATDLAAARRLSAFLFRRLRPKHVASRDCDCAENYNALVIPVSL